MGRGRGKQYLPEEKAKAMLAYESGAMGPLEIEKEYGIPSRTIKQWATDAGVSGGPGRDLTVARIAANANDEQAERIRALQNRNLDVLEAAIERALEMIPDAERLGEVVRAMEVAWLRHLDLTQGRPGVRSVTIDNRSVNVQSELIEALRNRPLADVLELAAPGPAANVEAPVEDTE